MAAPLNVPVEGQIGLEGEFFEGLIVGGDILLRGTFALGSFLTGGLRFGGFRPRLFAGSLQFDTPNYTVAIYNTGVIVQTVMVAVSHCV